MCYSQRVRPKELTDTVVGFCVSISLGLLAWYVIIKVICLL